MKNNKNFLLLFILVGTFNVGHNLKCYSCKSNSNKVCEMKLVTCEDEFFTKNEASCISAKHELSGEKFTYKGCKNMVKNIENYSFNKLEASYSTCRKEICSVSDVLSTSNNFFVFFFSLHFVF